MKWQSMTFGTIPAEVRLALDEAVTLGKVGWGAQFSRSHPINHPYHEPAEIVERRGSRGILERRETSSGIARTDRCFQCRL
jgi:hypothetical protein